MVVCDEEVVPHSGMSLFIRCCPPKGAIVAVPMGATRAATNEKGEEVVPHSGMYQLMCWLKRGVLVVRSWFRTSGKHIYF